MRIDTPAFDFREVNEPHRDQVDNHRIAPVIDLQPKPIFDGGTFPPVDPHPLGGAAAWGTLGMSWLWESGTQTLGPNMIMDPHSMRTIRLAFVVLVLVLFLIAVGGLLLHSWMKTTHADRAIRKGHFNASQYRSARDSKSKKTE